MHIYIGARVTALALCHNEPLASVGAPCVARGLEHYM